MQRYLLDTKMIKPINRNPKAKQAFKLSLAQKFLLVFGLIVLSFTALPTVIILLIGLMPTITAILTDSKNINKITVIGCFNMAGVFVCLVNLLNQYSANQEITILGNVFNIIIMLGAAALGMIIYFELPGLFVMISKSSAHRRLHNIENKLEKITSEWGQEIMNDVIIK